MSYKSSSILKIICVSLYLSGCANWPAPPSAPMKALSAENYFSGFTSGWVGNPVSITKMNGKAGGSPGGEQWYKTYCQEGKAVKKYSYQVKAVVPEPPPGMIVSDASKYRTAWLNAAEMTAVKIFLAGISKPETRTARNNENIQGKVVAIRSNSEKDIVADYKKAAYQVAGSTLNLPDSRSLMFLKATGNEKIFLVPRQAVILTNQYAVGSRVEGDKVQYMEAPLNRASQYSPFYIAQTEFSTFVTGKGYELVEFSPLSIAYLGDVSAMANQYVLLIPESEQKKFGLREYGPSDVKTAVQQRQKTFEDVVKKFTTVKEEQSDDPSVINYEVSLDLGLFCAYARPLSDFVSR